MALDGRMAANIGKDMNTGDHAIYYVYTDHLGSILSVTDDQGVVQAEQSFDAWGNRRDPSNWGDLYPAPPTQSWLYRGYTGHEQLDEFKIVHMNGRLYDAQVGRMFSPDNFNQAPFHTQGYNRYSYVMNNPLRYTDPSGEILRTAITFLWDLGATVYVKGRIDPWNSPQNRQEAWSQFDPTASWSKTNKAWQADKDWIKRAGYSVGAFTWNVTLGFTLAAANLVVAAVVVVPITAAGTAVAFLAVMAYGLEEDGDPIYVLKHRYVWWFTQIPPSFYAKSAKDPATMALLLLFF